jgi:tetratricopeptide (TPR) repeat protein
MRQIIDAEILVINKVDLIEPIRLPILEASVQQLNPKARIVLLSGKDTGEKFENFMQIVLPDIYKVPEKTPKVRAGENPELAALQETESSIEASGVGSYSAEYFGVLLSEMGHYEEAEKQYMLALEANPNNAAVHCYYGLLLLEMGRKQEAEKQYRFALEANPKDADVHYNYGVLLEEMGRKEEAEKQYLLALEADSNSA